MLDKGTASHSSKPRFCYEGTEAGDALSSFELRT